MPLESSIKVLYDENGNQLALSQSQQISSSQSYFLLAASSSAGQVTPVLISDLGHLFATGSVTINNPTVLPVTQSVYVGGLNSNITFTVSMSNSPIVTVSNPVTTASISNFPTTQSISGIVTASVAFPSVQNVSVVSSSVTQSITTATALPTYITSPYAQYAGLSAHVTAYGTLRISDEPGALFSDEFDSIDTTNKWTTTASNGGTVTASNGILNLNVGTTPFRGSALTSQPTFPTNGFGFRTFAVAKQISSGTITGSHQFWGFGTQQGLWSTSSAIFDGVGFESNLLGNLNAVVYSSGSLVFSQSLVRPTDGDFHTFAVLLRSDAAIFYFDNLEIPVASKTYPQTTTFNLPIRLSVINGLAPSFVPSSSFAAVGVADTARGSIQISDGVNPWRKATVDSSGSLFIAQGTSGSRPWKSVLYNENNTPVTNSNPLWVTGTVLALPFGSQTVAGTVTATQGNASATQNWRVFLSGSNFVSGGLVVSLTGSAVTQSVFVGGSTILPVSVSNTVTVTGSLGATVTFPALQNVFVVSSSITQSITGSVTINNPTVLPVTQSVYIGGSGIVFNVSMSNTPLVTVANPTTSVSVSNFPVTQSVKIDQSIQLPVSVSNFPITQSVFIGNSVLTVTGNLGTTVTFPNIQNVSIISSSVTQSVVPASYYNTSFGQFRTASPFTLLDKINRYGLNTLDYSTASIGAGRFNAVLSQSAFQLSVGTGSTDSLTIRTNENFRYQAGKQQVVKITAYHNDTGQTNQLRTWGYNDDSDGLFWALSGSSFGFYRKSSTTGTTIDTFTSQSSFNIDKLDGTGTSGVTLDLTKGNIYEFHIHWLGVGEVDLFVNGNHAHRFYFPNTIAGPYIGTATLPLNFLIKNTGVSTASSFHYICSAVESDGGEDPPEYSFAAYNETSKVVTTTESPLIAIRPGTTFNGSLNKIITFPDIVTIMTEGTRAGYRIIVNPTLSGSVTWQSASINSSVEFTTSSFTFTGGETIYRGFLPNGNDSREFSLRNFFPKNGRKLLVSSLNLTQDVLVIAGINEQAGTTDMKASISWREVR